ncbi:hypothetical protein L2E82_50508 [Cichorium intybus]|nr:hypothetical protein L2E82_50508 [Cichorium intybus]
MIQLCEGVNGGRNRALLAGEGAIPPLVDLSQTGTATAKHKISHKINKLAFGEYYPGIVNPLDGEGFAQKIKDEEGERCNIYGSSEVNKVAGNFHFIKSFHQSSIHIPDLLAFQEASLIVTNVAVFLLWRVVDRKFMMQNFMIQLDSFKSGRFHTMITSAFSLIEVGHIISNMIGLYFFCMRLGLLLVQPSPWCTMLFWPHHQSGSTGTKRRGAPGGQRRGAPGGLNKLCGITPELQVIVGESA